MNLVWSDLADGDFLKSIQVRFLSTLGDIKCLKGFCSDSNSRGFRRKISKVSANPWQAENNGTPRHRGAKSEWASGSHHS
jgi:hypothetical protein